LRNRAISVISNGRTMTSHVTSRISLPDHPMPLSNLEWVDYRVKCGRKPGEANT
jgi:hypothetical protein